MNNSSTPSLPAAQRDALEARFALRVRTRLDEGAQALPHDIGERLRVAREQAVEAARTARATSLAPAVVPSPVFVPQAGLSLAGSRGTTSLTAPTHVWHEVQSARSARHNAPPVEPPMGWGWRLALALPLIALVAGLWGIQRYQYHENVEATTAVDMQLLTDDLPPDAYADPGFEAYLSLDADPDGEQWVDAPVPVDGDFRAPDSAGKSNDL